MKVAGRLRRGVYLVNFLFSVQFGLALYFNSTFLKSIGLTSQSIAYVFAAGYALAILWLLLSPALLNRLGNYRVFLGAALLSAALYFSIPLMSEPQHAGTLLAAALSLSILLYFCLDVFLETASADEHKTGLRRGVMIGMKNGAFIVAQVATGYLLVHGSFSLLYAAAGAFLVLIALVASSSFRRFRDSEYKHADWLHVFRHLRKSQYLRRIFYIQFLLRLFYSAMVVYTPIYLHEHVGLSFESMGIIFAIMLVPFIVLEIPLGWLGDKRWGEREILILGFLITAGAVASMSFIHSAAILTWAAVLFITRVGASFIDVGSDAYFFKHMNGKNSGEVSAYRILYPLAFIAGPLSGAAFLSVAPLQYLFVALSMVLLTGTLAARWLRDTH